MLCYDVVRLIVIIGVITRLGRQSVSQDSYPYLVYASAQALFPIMAWFVYLNAEKYFAYLPLNIAGKCINIVLSGIWGFRVVSGFSETMSFEFFMCLGLTLIVMFTDIISIVGMAFIKKGLEKSVQDQNDIDQHYGKIESKADNTIGGI